MSARITKAEADAAARCLENALAGSPSEWEFVREDEDPDALYALLTSASQKLWDRTRSGAS